MHPLSKHSNIPTFHHSLMRFMICQNMKFSRITGTLALMIAAQALAPMLAGTAEANLNQAAAVPAESTPHSGNPVFDGWYADPEAAIFGNQYWISPLINLCSVTRMDRTT
jgi:hypothetical protein